jgi:hypothetical protein
VAVSVDQGQTWRDGGTFRSGLDLTDLVKGHRQYFIRFTAGAKTLAASGLTITTVCQANSSVLPRLKDAGTQVSFVASGNAIVSAGPTLPQAQSHVVAGRFGSPNVTLELKAPRGESVVAVYAAAHVLSSNPPDPEIKYQIEYSADSGRTWQNVVRDWSITRRGDEPADFWSQSFCWGSASLDESRGSPVQVRFRNNGGKNYARCEAHLIYSEGPIDRNGSIDRGGVSDATRVTFAYRDDAGAHQTSHVFDATAEKTARPAIWDIATGVNVRTEWVELVPVNPPR